MAISRKPKTGRLRRQAKTREQFVETAHQLLGELGRDKLSLREVARRTDYSPAAVYEYFSSKEELIDEVAVRVALLFSAELKKARKEEDPLTALALHYLDFSREHSADFLLIFGESRSVSERLGVKIYQVFLNTVASLSRKRGNVDSREDAKHAYKLWVAVHGMAMLQITHSGKKTSKEEMKSFVSELAI